MMPHPCRWWLYFCLGLVLAHASVPGLSGPELPEDPSHCPTDVMLAIALPTDPALFASAMQYVRARVAGTKFTGHGGHRMGVLTYTGPIPHLGYMCRLYDTRSDLNWCIAEQLLGKPIPPNRPPVPRVDTALAIGVATDHLKDFSDLSRARMIEGM